MRARLTTRGVTLLVGGVLVWVTGRLLGVPELSMVAVTSIALVGSSCLSLMLGTRAISASRTLAARCLDHGGRGGGTLELRNDGRGSSTSLLVEEWCPQALLNAGGPLNFTVPRVDRGQVVTLEYQIVGGARGRHTVGPLLVSARDPFGFAQRSWRVVETDELLVYPPIEKLPSHAIPGHQPLIVGDEFDTMREYVRGDDLRQIHWPSTAHRQRLMVRQHEQSRVAQACVFLDVRGCAHPGSGPGSTGEKAIGVAASLVAHLAAGGFQPCLVTEADQRSPRAQDLPRLMERLAEMKPSPMTSLAPAFGRVSDGEWLLIAVVRPPPSDGDLATSIDVRALARAGRGGRGRIAVVVAEGPGDARAHELTRILAGAGWRAAPIAPDQPLANCEILRAPGTRQAHRVTQGPP
ncbi:MAG: DUF58 domain-containing protein [Egibacteraceae bacterium]